MKSGRVFTREEATAALKRVARDGVPVFNALPYPLRRAILLYWGSMDEAREALSLRFLDAPRQVWSRQRVLEEIVALDRAGVHMSVNAVIAAGRNDLLVAAQKYAGGWTHARGLAGVKFKRRRLVAQHAWDATGVVEEIKRLHGREEALASSKAPKALVSAAGRIFGSWRDAIEAAGIDYETILLARTYEDGEILEWLRRLAHAKPNMTLWDLDRHGEHAVECRRRWGSYEAAAKAAGVTGWPKRRRSPAPTRASVLAQLRKWRREAKPLHIRAVRKTAGGHSLINGVLHHFKNWDDALAAARKPAKPRRTRRRT